MIEKPVKFNWTPTFERLMGLHEYVIQDVFVVCWI